MTRATLLLALSALLASGCHLFLYTRSPASIREVPAEPMPLLRAGIASYNDGKPRQARAFLQSAIERTETMGAEATGITRDIDLAIADSIRAAAHFYLAAAAWDLGDSRLVDHHLRQCRAFKPDYEPDWKFIAPQIRTRFDDLR